MAWSFALVLAATGGVLLVLDLCTSGCALQEPVFLTALAITVALGMLGGFRHDRSMRRRWTALQSGHAEPPA